MNEWQSVNPNLRCFKIFLFYFFKHLYWSIIALQWCFSFCFIYCQIVFKKDASKLYSPMGGINQNRLLYNNKHCCFGNLTHTKKGSSLVHVPCLLQVGSFSVHHHSQRTQDEGGCMENVLLALAGKTVSPYARGIWKLTHMEHTPLLPTCSCPELGLHGHTYLQEQKSAPRIKTRKTFGK